MEPFVDPLAGGLVGVLIDTARKIGGGFAQTIGDRAKTAAAIKRYADRYTARYGEIRLLGMKQGTSLEDIYTKVRFLDKLSIRQFASLRALEQTYREGQKRRFQIQQAARLDSLAVVNECPYLMVLGGPGAGKSTFLRRVGLEALKGERGYFKHRCIPVLLELKQFKSGMIDLIKAIADELANFGFPETETFTLKLLDDGKLLILLDGLDEVPKENQNTIIEVIQNFVTRYDKNRYISSCRVAAHRSTWNRFRDIEIADFDDEQIHQFIYNWFRSKLDQENHTAYKCWMFLNSPGNEAAKELAQTPLLLTFLCVVYDRTQGFPANRASLYRKALDILLEEWSAEKRVNQETIYTGLNPDLEKVLLSEIAYNGFINDQLFFTQQELVDQIRSFLADTVDKPKYLDSKSILDAIATQQGILVERAEDIFSFSHLTLQEYLTAQYISQVFGQPQLLVTEKLLEQRWREVFLLVAGLMSTSDRFLESIEQQASTYISIGKLKKLLNWAEKVTNSTTENYHPAAERSGVLAIFITLSLMLSRTFDSARARLLTSARSLIRVLDKSLGDVFDSSDMLSLSNARALTEPDLDDNLKRSIKYSCDFGNKLQEVGVFKTINFARMHTSFRLLESEARQLLGDQVAIDHKTSAQRDEMLRDFTDRILQIWLEFLGLEPELINISEEEARALSNYLYASELMVKCKESAVRVSEKVWMKIEERMLTAREE